VPPRQSPTLTEAELRIMHVLWQKRSATVQDVLDALPTKPALAYNSVLTTIRILEKKGYLKHVKDGRAHLYVPVVGRKDASRSEIRHLIRRFFGDSHQELVLNIVEAGDLDLEELDRLKEMLAKAGSK